MNMPLKEVETSRLLLFWLCNMKSSSNVIVTLYSVCPSSVTIKPSSEPFEAGKRLNCTSDGYPEPSYKWTDEAGKVVYGGPFNLTCTATGNFTKSCNASNSVSGNASGKHCSVYVLFVFIHLSRKQA